VLGRATLDEPHKEHHNGDHEQDVDKTAHRGLGDDSQQPQNDEHNGDGVEHKGGWGVGYFFEMFVSKPEILIKLRMPMTSLVSRVTKSIPAVLCAVWMLLIEALK
jgi:hypothetical protein